MGPSGDLAWNDPTNGDVHSMHISVHIHPLTGLPIIVS